MNYLNAKLEPIAELIDDGDSSVKITKRDLNSLLSRQPGHMFILGAIVGASFGWISMIWLCSVLGKFVS